VRWREPRTYMEKTAQVAAVSNEEEVAATALPFEFMLNTLRLREGFALPLFCERTGLPRTALEPGLTQAVDKGWLSLAKDHLCPTEHGFDFLSNVQQLFLPPRGNRPAAP
jgi:coproporphyrinogen III oxidase-like Fe-S oxidoreductase